MIFPDFTRRFAALLTHGCALAAPVLRAEPVVLFDAKGLSRDWTPHSWGGLDAAARKSETDATFPVKLKGEHGALRGRHLQERSRPRHPARRRLAGEGPRSRAYPPGLRFLWHAA